MKKVFLALFLSLISVTLLFSQEVGNATYYSKRMHGKRTSNGDKYHNDSLTCAHKSYPFGTLLLVRNPKNNKEVVVKVTDRGPFGRKLIIDLSYQAAKEIDILTHGVALVEVSIFDPIHVPYKARTDIEPNWDMELAFPLKPNPTPKDVNSQAN